MLTDGIYDSNWQPEFIHIHSSDGQKPLVGGLEYENNKNLYVFAQNGFLGKTSISNFSTSQSIGCDSDWHVSVELSKSISTCLFQACRQNNKNEIFRSFNKGINNYEQISNFNLLFANDHTAFWILFNPEKQPNTLYAFMHVNMNGNPNNKKFFLYRNDNILNPDANAVKNSWYRLPLPTDSWLAGIVSSDEDPNIVY